MDTPSQTTLSVAMCTYNSMRFLAPQLESIVAQTRLPNEVVFCDDGSSDGTVEALRRWALGQPFQVHVFQNLQNLGYTKNFEKAISLCTGEVIFLSDHDDVWMPRRIERTMEVFEKRPEVGLVTTNADIIDERGQSQGMSLREFVRRMHVHEFWRFFYPPGQKMTLWTGCTMAIRRSLAEALLPIPGNLSCHDIWLYLLAPLVSQSVFLDENLVQYRLHGQNHSTAPTVEHLRKSPPKWHYFNTFIDTLHTHPGLIDALYERASQMPACPLRDQYLRQLRRNQRHFNARENACRSLRAWLGELFNGGYLAHPQAIRSALYDRWIASR